MNRTFGCEREEGRIAILPMQLNFLCVPMGVFVSLNVAHL